MTSLYDLLGARADDDEQAIKKAFRKAVRANHPDLHPDDPDAVLRFRRIITASAILRDPKQRAAYDELLELERQRIKLQLDKQFLRLKHERRQIWWKRIGATAAVGVVGGLICAYGLFLPMPATVIEMIMKDRPAAGTVPMANTATIVEAIRKDKVAASAVPAGAREHAASDMPVEVVTAKTSGITTPEVPVGDDVAGPLTAGHAVTPDASSTGDAAEKGEGPVVADRGEPTPAVASGAPLDGFHRKLGISFYRSGDFPRAIANLDEAIGLDPNDAQAYAVRGNAWDEIGAFDNALADYDEAIRIDPSNPDFFHERAVLWHRNGNLDKALLDLDRAVRFSFSDPSLYCDRGLVWYEKGSHARAIADFDHATKLDPASAAACINRGLILHGNSAFTPAFADLGKSIHVSPSVFDVSQKLK